MAIRERDVPERLVSETNQQCVPTTWSAACGCLVSRQPTRQRRLLFPLKDYSYFKVVSAMS